jgi:glucose uptake protein GlcU
LNNLYFTQSKTNLIFFDTIFVDIFQSLFARESMVMGILAGCLWNCGNICAVLAIPVLGYGLAFPIVQCSILVAGVWGLGWFEEFKGLQVWVFAIAGVVLLSGAAMLSVGYK